MKIRFFKKEKSFKKGKENPWLNINLCWRSAVFFMFVVLFLSFSFGYYLFIQTNKEPVLSPVAASPEVETVKKERIEKVLEYFSKREQKSNQILNSPAPVVDPSL